MHWLEAQSCFTETSKRLIFKSTLLKALLRIGDVMNLLLARQGGNGGKVNFGKCCEDQQTRLDQNSA